MKIYVASSWRNEQQPAVVEALRAEGHEVYDFKNPAPGDHGFSWKQITDEKPPWSADATRNVLSTSVANHGFRLDFGAMHWADACVMLQPCGRSAAMELGWMAGASKFTIVQLADDQEPELMVKMAARITCSLEDTIEQLRTHSTKAWDLVVGRPVGTVVDPYHIERRTDCGAIVAKSTMMSLVSAGFVEPVYRLDIPTPSPGRDAELAAAEIPTEWTHDLVSLAKEFRDSNGNVVVDGRLPENILVAFRRT